MSSIKQRKHTPSTKRLATGMGLSGALLAGMMSTTAMAATQQGNNSIQLPEVSVSAAQESAVGDYSRNHRAGSKFTQPVSKTPQTIQIIDSAIIEDQHATTLTEALRNSPGVGTFYAGENGSTTTGDAVYMRGFDSSGSIFVDGVRDLGAVSRDTFNVEQIEVTKGPNGADYGRTAPGGSINMVTKQARLNNAASLGLSYGTDNQKRATVDVNRRINSTTAVRLNVMGEDSDVAGRDAVENKRWGIAPTISFGLGTDTRLTLDYLHVTQNNVPDGAAATIGLPGYTSPASPSPLDRLPQPDSDNFYGTHNDFDDVSIDRASAHFEQDFSNARFHNTTRWARIDQSYLLSAFMANDPALWVPGDLSSINMRRLPNFMDQTNTIVTNQMGIVQWADTGAIHHTFSYGLELTHERVESRDVSAPLGATGKPLRYSVNAYNPSHSSPNYHGVKTGAHSKGTVDTAAIYLFDTMEIGKHWQVTGGMRLDHYSADYESNSTTCGGRRQAACGAAGYTVAANPTISDSDNLFTWQLGALYQINAAGNIYVDYAVAAQPPGGKSLGFSSRASSQDQAGLDPQQATTAEIGTKWQFADGRLLLTAAVYRTEVDNQMEEVLPGQYETVGNKRVKGIELTATGQITPNWNVSAGVTTMDAEITKGAADANDGSNDIPYSPTKAFTSWSTYRLPFGLTVGGGVRYMGELKRGHDGAKGTPESTESYWVADAMLSYPVTQQLDVQLNVYNITDEDYVAAINKSGYRYTPGTPRSAILSVNYDF